VDRRFATLFVCALALSSTACNRPAASPPAGAEAGGGVGVGSAGGGGMPSGAIVAFSGQVPPGWTVCDGRMTPTGRPTPDLRARFILGADPNTGEAGQVGGNATHTHAATAAANKAARGTETDNDVWMAASNHTHDVAVTPADSLPPYVKLVYAMKD
jgi:hypothetical protein